MCKILLLGLKRIQIIYIYQHQGFWYNEQMEAELDISTEREEVGWLLDRVFACVWAEIISHCYYVYIIYKIIN